MICRIEYEHINIFSLGYCSTWTFWCEPSRFQYLYVLLTAFQTGHSILSEETLLFCFKSRLTSQHNAAVLYHCKTIFQLGIIASHQLATTPHSPATQPYLPTYQARSSYDPMPQLLTRTSLPIQHLMSRHLALRKRDLQQKSTPPKKRRYVPANSRPEYRRRSRRRLRRRR